MRLYPVVALALFVSANQAMADSKSYCEIYAKDFASSQTSDVDQWQLTYRNTFADCMSQYSADTLAPVFKKKKIVETEVIPEETPAPAPVKVKAKQKTKTAVVQVRPPKAVAQAEPIAKLEPGSDEWNAYCDKKYASFNSETGTYTSYTGKERRCVVAP